MKKVFSLLLSLILIITTVSVVDFSAFAETDVLLFGDLNDDGKISSTDVSKIYAYLNGNTYLSEKEKILADVTGDGNIDTNDVDYLYKVVNKEISQMELPVYANTVSGYCGDDVVYIFNNETSVLKIAGTGDMYSLTQSPWYDEREKIKSVNITESVTSIGNNTFKKCKNLINVTMPNSITSIGYGAFSGCSSLTSVTIPDGVVSIGNGAFMSCSNLTNITIPDSVTSIGNFAFDSCSSLVSVIIPDSVTNIGYETFMNCSSLENVIIPDGVTSIDNQAFLNCSSLTSIAIPDSVTSIGDSAFRNCSSLISATISQRVTSIGDYVFRDCSSLTSVTIPHSVTNTGNFTFFDCSSLTSVTIQDGVASIGHYAFFGCKNLINLIIPNSITSIGNGAFNFATNLEKVAYNGTHSKWKSIQIQEYNEALTSAKIEMLDDDHTVVTNIEKEATCTESGLTQGSHCSVCNEVLVKQESIPMIPHQYKSSVVQSTADSQGYTKYTCSVCGDTYNASYFDAASVYSDIKSATAGATIRVPVSIKNNTGILGWKLTFDYDTDVLTPISVDYGEVISGGIQDNIEGDMVPGSINVYWAGSDNEDYNGVMFYINFEVNNSAVGNTKIDITYSPEDTFDTDFNDVYLDCQPINLSIINSAYSQYAKINASADDITAGDDLQLKLNISEINSVSKTNVTVDYNADNFELKSVSSANGMTVKSTDNNGRLVLDVLGITSSVNNTDFVTVTFKCKDKAMSGSYDFAVSSTDKGIICKGCTVKVKPSATSEIADIYADDVISKYNDEITIPIYIDNNHGVMGYRLDFKYDTNLFQPISTTCGADFSKNGQFNDSIGVKDGEFKVLWNNIDEKFVNGILLNLKFKVLTDEKVDTIISMTYSQPDTFNEKYEDVVFNCKDINVSLNNHQHNYTAVVTAPTCAEKGYTTYTCSCGDSYIADEKVALGHNYISNVVAPTCTQQGYTEHTCSRCNDIYNDNYTSVSRHSYDNGVITTQPTCESDGVKTYTCTVCGNSYTEKVGNLGHNYKAVVTKPTCTEKGYTTHTCLRCGESYIDNEVSVLGHSYGQWTYNGDSEYISSSNYKNGTQTKTCSVCDEKETVEAPNTALLRRRGNALALESSITLTTYITKDIVDYYDEVYAEFTRNGKTETVYASDKIFKSGSTVYNIFDYAGISPQAMGDDIEIKFYGIKDGVKYWGETYTYSVTTYVTSTLSKSTTSDKLKTMLVDLMYYGEACQIYQNYKTDSLMTNILTDEQKKYRSTDELNLKNIKDSSYATCENRLVKFGTALRLNNAVEIAIPLNMTNVTLEELTFKVKIGSRDLTYTYSDNLENFEKGKDGYWYFYFDGVYANQMSDEVFITAYRGDEQVSYTLKYSVESYAATVTDSKLKKVTDAMMRYGNSAKAYSGK